MKAHQIVKKKKLEMHNLNCISENQNFSEIIY